MAAVKLGKVMLRLNSISTNSKRTTALLLLIIVILGSVALYYSPLFPRSPISVTQVAMTQFIPAGSQIDPVSIYAQANLSVVTVEGVVNDPTNPPSGLSGVLGTGFVVAYANSYYIVTNFHVVDGLLDSTVTFSNGDAFPARVVGSDSYSDLAVVAVNASPTEFHPLQLGVSSTLKVGESVVAIGNPYGFSGTITVGIVSQVGRSLQDQTSGAFVIADTIQFSAPINPGNSGGPLLNSGGLVVGVTTAVASGSQGLGFAIPSDTIARELPYLVKDGSYNRHPYLGVRGLLDMTYQLAQAMGTNTTSGVLIQSTIPGGPAESAGLRGGTQNVTIDGQQYTIGGDIIVSLDGNRIVNYDALTSYLERHAVTGQTIQVGIIRSGRLMTIPVTMGTRPALALIIDYNISF
jgi:S1-C subfamily serine protease